VALLAWAGYLDSALGWRTHRHDNGMHRVERVRAAVVGVVGVLVWSLALTSLGIASLRENQGR